MLLARLMSRLAWNAELITTGGFFEDKGPAYDEQRVGPGVVSGCTEEKQRVERGCQMGPRPARCRDCWRGPLAGTVGAAAAAATVMPAL